MTAKKWLDSIVKQKKRRINLNFCYDRQTDKSQLLRIVRLLGAEI